MSFLIVFLGLLLKVLWFALLIRVILSWFPVDPSNPIVRVLWEITEPILAPLRRLIRAAARCALGSAPRVAVEAHVVKQALQAECSAAEQVPHRRELLLAR